MTLPPSPKVLELEAANAELAARCRELEGKLSLQERRAELAEESARRAWKLSIWQHPGRPPRDEG